MKRMKVVIAIFNEEWKSKNGSRKQVGNILCNEISIFYLQKPIYNIQFTDKLRTKSSQADSFAFRCLLGALLFSLIAPLRGVSFFSVGLGSFAASLANASCIWNSDSKPGS